MVKRKRKTHDRGKRGEKCALCGKPGFSDKSPYCRDCSHFCTRLSNERFPPETCEALRNEVRRNGGLFCHYTQLELNVFDYEDPYFLEFDHVIPGDPKDVVMCCAWINEIKGDMTKAELRRSVRQLYGLFFKGIKIKKQKFRYWFRLMPPSLFSN